MIREVCKKCHHKHYAWSSSDEDRWDNHELVLCPPQLASTANAGRKAEDRDIRVTRNVTGNDDIPDWCPFKQEHVRNKRRRKRSEREQDPLGPF